VAIDGAGDVIVGGDFQPPIDLGGGALSNSGAFVAKFGPSGSPQWSKAFGAMGSTSTLSALAVDGAGDVTVTGSFSGTIDCGGGPLRNPGTTTDTIFVAKLDAGGNHLWSKVFGDGTNAAFAASLRLGPNGVVLAGTYTKSVTFGGATLTPAGGATDADFVVALDPGGNHVWSRSLPSTTNVAASVDGAGNIALAGSFQTTADFGGGPIMPVGGSDVVVVELDPAGNHVWSKGFGSAADDGASAVAFDGAGHVVVAGYASGAINLGGGALPAATSFVVALGAGGDHVWSDAFTGSVQVQSVAADTTGVFLAGVASGSIGIGTARLPASARGIDLLVLKLDPSGAYLWGRRAGDGAGASASQISVNAGHASAIAGSARNGAIDLGTGPLSCIGMCAMVAALGP
jgi:hypothetical protein